MKVVSCKIRDLSKRYPRLGISSFQRALVWKPQQKAALIRSILSEYPTGTIVLNRLDQAPGLRGPQAGVELASSHDVIDGQQRLTTLYEFLADPLAYFTIWARKAPRRNPFEPSVVEGARFALNELRKELRRPAAQYVPARTPAKILDQKIASDAQRHLNERREGKTVSNPAFHQLVERLDKFVQAVTAKQFVVEELAGIDDEAAEMIFHIINMSGTALRWWELLGQKGEFVRSSYTSAQPYRTRHDANVGTLAIRRRVGGVLQNHPTPASYSYWSAMFALGEYYHWWFAGSDPMTQPRPMKENDPRRIPIDGLGFRLVSGFLGHDVGRAAVYELFRYPEDLIRQAIDLLFETADILFRSPSVTVPDFRLFDKYARFDSGAIPAYPLVGLIISTSKYVGQHMIDQGKLALGGKDKIALRSLTEEMFREVICTNQWAGTGDKKLKTWLNAHFPLIPTGGPGSLPAVIASPANSTYDRRAWMRLLRGLSPNDRRTVDRSTAALHFWVQYLFDSKVKGCLPKGSTQFDHIVPFMKTRGSPTTHPLNIAPVSRRLNESKGSRTFDAWNPTGADAQEYRLNTLCQVQLDSLPAAANSNFLRLANAGDIRALIDERARVFEFALGKLIPDWISNGDS